MEPITKNTDERTEAGDSELDRLRQEVQREHDLYLRALADFDNYRRRVERERATAARSGTRDIIVSLLEVLDGFDRALRHLPEESSATGEGLRAIHRKLMGLLEAQGVTPVESLGEIFDPELHEAIGTVAADEQGAGGQEAGRVVDEAQRGYRWGEELLRPARVRVAE
jgi:molecular chaperone GrpE